MTVDQHPKRVLIDAEGNFIGTGANPLVVTEGGGGDVTGPWVVGTISDTTLNDSDKSFVVPAATERQILWILVAYAASGTVGNRQLAIEVQITGPAVSAHLARAAIVQLAGTTYNYLFAPGVADMPSLRDSDFLTTPIPPTTVLKAGDTLRIWDNNAIDAAADDMTIRIQHADRTVS